MTEMPDVIYAEELEMDKCPDCGQLTLHPSGAYCIECNPIGDEE